MFEPSNHVRAWLEEQGLFVGSGDAPRAVLRWPDDGYFPHALSPEDRYLIEVLIVARRTFLAMLPGELAEPVVLVDAMSADPRPLLLELSHFHTLMAMRRLAAAAHPTIDVYHDVWRAFEADMARHFPSLSSMLALRDAKSWQTLAARQHAILSEFAILKPDYERAIAMWPSRPSADREAL